MRDAFKVPKGTIDTIFAPAVKVVRGHHRCTGSICPDESHRRRDDLFVNDQRPGSQWAPHHEGGLWVCWYLPVLPPELLDRWMAVNGSTTGTFQPTALEAVPWADGRTLLLGRSDGGIFDVWLCIEDAR